MRPLVVDLDNTLLRTDLLAELLPGYLLRNPLALPRVLGWLRAGRARLKEAIAERCPLDPATLPYNQEVLDWLREEHARGREIWLASASHRIQVEAIAAHLGLFAATIATEGDDNLKGERKREALVARFGAGGFDYAGDSRADLAVWRDAHSAIVVGNDERLARQAGELVPVALRLSAPRSSLRVWPEAFRLHQWLKNGLVLIPLLTAHLWSDGQAVTRAMLAFLAFGFAASAIYVLNDLADLVDDRRHPVKRGRPLASGRLAVPQALTGAALLGMFALVCAAALPARFGLWLVAYLLTTTVYSAWLKRRPIVDVMCLAGLYSVRLLAGAAAIGVDASFWLLAFSMFLFLSLALIKRDAELRRQAVLGGGRIARNYDTDDLPVIVAAGVGAAMSAVMVLALYIQSDQTRAIYSHPERIWVACPVLLYWVLRAWFRANRGRIDEDPVAWAAKDPVSWLAAALIAGAFAAAL